MTEKSRTCLPLSAQSVHGDGEEAGVDDGREDEDSNADEHRDESENPGNSIDESGVAALSQYDLVELEESDDVDGLLAVIPSFSDGELIDEDGDIAWTEKRQTKRRIRSRQNSLKNVLYLIFATATTEKQGMIAMTNGKAMKKMLIIFGESRDFFSAAPVSI